jgi:hypothetical protein
MTNEINKFKREPSLIPETSVIDPEHASQVTNCRRTSEVGSPLRIHLRTTTLPLELVTVVLQSGSSSATLSRNGTQMVLSCGSMESVSLFPPIYHPFLLLTAADLPIL